MTESETFSSDYTSTDPLPAAENFRSFALTVAYDGTNYGGWQRQINNTSIQARLEEAIQSALGVNCKTLASGRTDKGVHAVGQVVRFRTNRWKHESYKLIPAINRWLPPDISVQAIRQVIPIFNPIKYATSKTYRYQIRMSKCPDPFEQATSWYFRRELDLTRMKSAAECLLGKHDFASFQADGSPRSSTIRTIKSLVLQSREVRTGTMLLIDIQADGFLYNMARNIVGTLVDIGARNLPPTLMTNILQARLRRLAGQTAPACGLCLLHVEYPANVYLED